MPKKSEVEEWIKRKKEREESKKFKEGKKEDIEKTKKRTDIKNEKLERWKKEKKEIESKKATDLTSHELEKLKDLRHKIRRFKFEKKMEGIIEPGELEKALKKERKEKIEEKAEKIQEKKGVRQGKTSSEGLRGWVGVRAKEKLAGRGVEEYESVKELLEEIRKEHSKSGTKQEFSITTARDWVYKYAEKDKKLQNQIKKLSDKGRAAGSEEAVKTVREATEKSRELVKKKAEEKLAGKGTEEYGSLNDLTEEIQKESSVEISSSSANYWINEYAKKNKDFQSKIRTLKDRKTSKIEKLRETRRKKAEERYEKIAQMAERLKEEKGEEIESFGEFCRKLQPKLEEKEIGKNSRWTIERALEEKNEEILNSMKKDQ